MSRGSKRTACSAHMRRVGLSAPERASADWWPSRYERDEVVVAMRRPKEEFIAEAVKK